MTGSPQSCLGHPAPQRLLAHRDPVQFVQILACQRGSESSVNGVGKDRHGSLLHFARQLPIGFSPAQLMDDRLVSFAPQLPQEPAYLPLGDADLLGSLFLRDQFLLGFLQSHQPVSLGLGHQQLSFVHPPCWPLSIGHFYFAQIGHYYFAATVPEYCRSTPTECVPCLGNPVSSITHAGSGSSSAVIRRPIRSHTGFQAHGLCPMNCCMACTFPSGRRVAKGSIDFRSPFKSRLRTYTLPQCRRSARPTGSSRSIRNCSSRFRHRFAWASVMPKRISIFIFCQYLT